MNGGFAKIGGMTKKRLETTPAVKSRRAWRRHQAGAKKGEVGRRGAGATERRLLRGDWRLDGHPCSETGKLQLYDGTVLAADRGDGARARGAALRRRSETSRLVRVGPIFSLEDGVSTSTFVCSCDQV